MGLGRATFMGAGLVLVTVNGYAQRDRVIIADRAPLAGRESSYYRFSTWCVTPTRDLKKENRLVVRWVFEQPATGWATVNGKQRMAYDNAQSFGFTSAGAPEWKPGSRVRLKLVIKTTSPDAEVSVTMYGFNGVRRCPDDSR
jgi:hypothetical protein